jgi:photosystem II stability/assembly factor-like uncharacterized protein
VGGLVLIGTSKGAFLVREDGVDSPMLPGWAVNHAMRDPRDGTFYVAANSWTYGGTVQRSSDGGRTWERCGQVALPEESGLTVKATWHVEPGHASEPLTLYLGVDPGALFRSDDGGDTWEAVRGILEHPTRDRWAPGAGGLTCHSIQVAPDDPQRLYVGISAAGSFRSEDRGETWTPANANVAADFMPEPFPEVGQCVHKLLLHPARPERLWQQNHCGVYRSDDAGRSWERLEGNGLPSGFGFPIALDPNDPDVAYVIPEEGAENRVTANGRLGVYRTDNGGASWRLLEGGLPERAWTGVLREGMSFDADGAVYFGTQNGSLWVTRDTGENWTEWARDLPPILSVEAWSS